MGMYAQVFSLENLKWVNKNISDIVVHEHVSLIFTRILIFIKFMN